MSLTRKLIEFISRREPFHLATTSAQIPPYLTGYEQAVRFTKSLGFDTSSLVLGDVHTDVLVSGSFVDPVFEAAQISDRAEAAGQCLKWCHYLQPYFEQHLGKQVFLTTGQLWKGEDCVFGPSLDDVRRWTKSGLQAQDFGNGTGFKLHAWLTVESGEIIEPTLLSSFAMFGDASFRKFAGATVWGRDPCVLNKHRYVPLTVGREVVERIANLSAVPLLARNPSELGLACALISL